MTDDRLGKIDADTFDSVIAPRLGADREDVRVGPTAGVDFGVFEAGGQAVVTATDPLSFLPELGPERAGKLALDIVLADVAVSGVAPTHATISLTLPPDFPDDTFAGIWAGIDAHARNLGVAIVSGHTGYYADIESSWVGGATAFGVGDFESVVRPDGATPGDALIVSTGPAPKSPACSRRCIPRTSASTPRRSRPPSGESTTSRRSRTPSPPTTPGASPRCTTPRRAAPPAASSRWPTARTCASISTMMPSRWATASRRSVTPPNPTARG
ncbi:hypothetical protein GJ629_08795 [Halapricum sp. CBA1109]|nr:hypothetical protein [Halapricum sp. CBA1109]